MQLVIKLKISFAKSLRIDNIDSRKRRESLCRSLLAQQGKDCQFQLTDRKESQAKVSGTRKLKPTQQCNHTEKATLTLTTNNDNNRADIFTCNFRFRFAFVCLQFYGFLCFLFFFCSSFAIQRLAFGPVKAETTITTIGLSLT